MSSLPDPLLDERWDELVAELRAARPEPAERLREHVRELARAPVPMRTQRRFTPRRLLLLIPAALAAGALAVAIGALDSRSPSSRSEESAAGGAREATTTLGQATQDAGEAHGEATGEPFRAAAVPQRLGGLAIPPATGRAQEYRAELRVLVPDVDALGDATTDAMRAARQLGGYVVSASYGAPGDGDGDSTLVVRVPVGRVQQAIARFSRLGTLLAQQIELRDLQAQLDRQADAIAALRRRIDRLEAELRKPGLTDEVEARLRERLVEARRSLATRERGREGTKRRAATARIALTLTTRSEVEPVVPPKESDFERTLRDALSLVATTLTWILAALVVASPFLALAVAVIALERWRRRAHERRLLERPAP